MSVLHFLSLFGRLTGPFPVPVKTASAVARSRRQGRPNGRRVSRLALDGDEHGRTLIATEMNRETSRASRAAGFLFLPFLAVLVWMPSTADAQLSENREQVIASAVDEAAARFGVPEAWIYAVMQRESRGHIGAVSPKGAVGLMQLMPLTWRDLTAEFGLGDDPFEPRANVLAGTAYMRRMYDRFGAPGFLAAYNAGPERYARSLANGSSLPLETRDYVRNLAPIITSSSLVDPRERPTTDWRAAAIFIEHPIVAPDLDEREKPVVQARKVWP
ncbi:lytic transglycosylase domain-containing protein [Caulobacter sp. BE254]|uniref:lytic transglycosylase domain-containing protein n=1 Tax=Caulobacter sp. BE254 TaxID=2817720 RepID=UPI00285B2124|nr:lytic transglycosylase domain-containing protein [Caulobacter sp. BE254]MDR7117364.1 soluble lytic murein transglycosylase-like protein [Caulobacter sp. BE254]